MKINDLNIETRKIVLSGNKSEAVSFQYLPQSLGKYTVDVNGQTATFNAVKPAHFNIGPITIIPEVLEVGEEFKASVEVANDGDIAGTYIVILRFNETEVSSQSIEVDPGQIVAARAVYTPKTSGTYVLEYCGVNKAVQVKERPVVVPPSIVSSPHVVPVAPRLITYRSSSLYYKIAYPPTFSVDDSDSYSVIIEDATSDITILMDRLSVDETPETYFDSILADTKKLYPTWTSSAETEIKENNVTIGYKFGFSRGKSWVGKGLVFKKGGFGFFIAFTTPEAEWKSNEGIVIRCLDSFVLPNIVSGSYSNPSLGISINLPAGWSLIETGETDSPIAFHSPYNEPRVNGKLYIKPVARGTTPQQWIADLAVRLGSTDGGVQIPFSFTNSITGHEFSDLLAKNDEIVGKLRYIAMVVDTRVFYFFFIGTPTTMGAQEYTVSDLTRSLVVAPP
ncbi:hypothetical protein ACFLVZ_02295 [Chloroflexota bacterium]